MFVMNEKMFTVQFNMTGEISLQEIFISEQKTVGDLREKLSVSSPGSEIVIRNHLLELREDAKLAEVTEEGDTLTAFKRRSEADDDIEEADDFFVVILSSVTKELVFLRPGEAAQLQLQEVAHNQIVKHGGEIDTRRLSILCRRETYLQIKQIG